PGPIGMYVCGPTVYQRAHVGNARPFVVFSWLRNWLREQGYEVTFVHNITDVNDSIYEAAPGRSAELAAQATAWYLEDIGGLGLALGPWPPRLAHRVLGDGREAPRPALRAPWGGARHRVPAQRERARPVAGARQRIRADLDAQRDAPHRRREDVQVGRKHRH